MTTRCVLLAGGVGGAKLALGLARTLPGPALAVVANVGDDFEHLGLSISPDLDTLVYTLAGVVNPETGWGRRDESWHCLETLGALGGEDWFRLGDRDLAVHLLRTRWLAEGATLTEVTARLAGRLGVETRVLPVTDARVPTVVETDAGTLPFQRYFVEHRCKPVLRRLAYRGAGDAAPTPAVCAALADPALAAVLIAPSNPYLSIDPLLAVGDLRARLAAAPAPVVAVSPIIAGAAIKGPTAKIMGELGVRVSATSVARHYRGLIDGFILDSRDAALAGEIESLGCRVRTCNTLMNTLEDRTTLAREALDFAATLREDTR